MVSHFIIMAILQAGLISLFFFVGTIGHFGSSLSSEVTRRWSVQPCLSDTRLQNPGIVICNHSTTTLITIALSTIDFPVQHLTLLDNDIPTLSDNMFSRTNITDLLLTRNKIKNIAKSAFSGLEFSLRLLDLRENLLTDIPTEAISNLLYLEDLRLSSNKIISIPNGAFKGLRKLKKLQLSHNMIVKVGDNGFDGMPLLTQLSLDSNNLKEIPYAIQRLRYLIQFSMQRNKVSSILKGAFSGQINSLMVLDLENNTLRKMPTKAIRNLTALQTLKLGNNQISKIPSGALRGLEDTLNFLSLARNRLTSIPLRALQHCRKLSSLDLSRNQISYIPAFAFSGMVSLHWLYLQHNGIVNIHKDAFKHLPEMRWLHLRGNQISILLEGTFNDLRETLVDMQDNPLSCSCGMSWLVELAANQNHSVEIDAFCGYPPLLVGQPLKILSTRYICPEPATYGTNANSAHTRTVSVLLLSYTLIICTHKTLNL